MMDDNPELHKDKKKKKPRKIAKRKGKKRQQTVLETDVEEVIGLVSGLKPPGVEIEDTQSQPQSRRGSSMANTMPMQYLLNPQEVARRASDIGMLKVSFEEPSVDVDQETEIYTKTLRGSTKRGSVTLGLEDEEAQLTLKRIKSSLKAMETTKKAQQEFCWDSVCNTKKKENEPKEGYVR